MLQPSTLSNSNGKVIHVECLAILIRGQKNKNKHPFNGPFLGLTRSAKKVKPIWTLLKQETVSVKALKTVQVGDKTEEYLVV